MATHKRKKPPDPNMLLRIEVAMRRKGMNQKALAEATGRTESAVAHWFNGRHEPDKPALRRLASVLGVSLDWLMGKPFDAEKDLDLERYILDLVKEGGADLLKAFQVFSTEELAEIVQKAADTKLSLN